MLFYLLFFLSLIHTLCLSCFISAEFPLPLQGKLLLYIAEGVSVMMGTLQRNFLPSVQGTEEFVLIFRFFWLLFLPLSRQPAFACCFFSVTPARSSEITLFALDVHKEQARVTRAFPPLQNGICFTCPDVCCHCSILSVIHEGKSRLSLERMLTALHASAAADCWSSHSAEHHLLTKQTPCRNSILNLNASASLGRLEPS